MHDQVKSHKSRLKFKMVSDRHKNDPSILGLEYFDHFILRANLFNTFSFHISTSKLFCKRVRPPINKIT